MLTGTLMTYSQSKLSCRQYNITAMQHYVMIQMMNKGLPPSKIQFVLPACHKAAV